MSDGLAFVSALFFAIAAYPRATRASRATQIPRRPKSLGKSVYHFINCSVLGFKKIDKYMLYQSGEHNLTKCWVSVGSIELMGMIPTSGARHFWCKFSNKMAIPQNVRLTSGVWHHGSSDTSKCISTAQARAKRAANFRGLA